MGLPLQCTEYSALAFLANPLSTAKAMSVLRARSSSRVCANHSRLMAPFLIELFCNCQTSSKCGHGYLRGSPEPLRDACRCLFVQLLRFLRSTNISCYVWASASMFKRRVV